MNREDAKDLTLSILVVVNIGLMAVCAWLYVKSCKQDAVIDDVARKVEQFANPPQKPVEPSFVDKAKATCEKVKNAAVKGFEAAKQEYKKDNGK